MKLLAVFTFIIVLAGMAGLIFYPHPMEEQFQHTSPNSRTNLQANLSHTGQPSNSLHIVFTNMQVSFPPLRSHQKTN